MGSSRKLRFRDFISIISLRTGLQEQTVKRVYKKMVELIEEEIRINGEIHLEELGVLWAKVIPGGDRKVPLATGGSVKRYCAPSITMRFAPSLRFKQKLNEKIILGHDEHTKAILEEMERNKGLNAIRDRLDELFVLDDDEKLGTEYYNDLMEEEMEDENRSE